MSETGQECKIRLSEIAYAVYNSNRGSFLKAIADAWMKADPFNKMILAPAWMRIITKYDLEKEASN